MVNKLREILAVLAHWALAALEFALEFAVDVIDRVFSTDKDGHGP